MQQHEIEALARIAGKEGAHETLLALGIDASNPLETQRDFAHLRWWRQIAESIMRTAIVAFFISAGGTLATLVWVGFKLSVKQ